MLKVFQKSFKILINNMLFLQPLLLYSIFIIATMYALNGRNILPVGQILYFVTMFLMSCAVFAGWFYINKLGVEHYQEDCSEEKSFHTTVSDFKEFFTGVSLNIGKFIFGMIIFLFAYFFITNVISHLLVKLFGIEQALQALVKSTAVSQAEVIKTFSAFSDNEQFKIGLLFIVVLSILALIQYWGILLLGVLQSNEKNWFNSLWQSIKFFFRYFLSNVAAIIFLFSLFVVFNLAFGFASSNVVLSSIFTLLMLLYFNYYVIVVLCFYHEKREDNSNSRTELIG